jgi:hypothetical protein
MSDRWILSTDPREGEWPEQMPDLCPHGIDQHEADCGRCLREELAASTTTDVLGAALVAMLDRIQEREDETKGAFLAARFEKASE